MTMGQKQAHKIDQRTSHADTWNGVAEATNGSKMWFSKESSGRAEAPCIMVAAIGLYEVFYDMVKSVSSFFFSVLAVKGSSKLGRWGNPLENVVVGLEASLTPSVFHLKPV